MGIRTGGCEFRRHTELFPAGYYLSGQEPGANGSPSLFCRSIDEQKVDSIDNRRFHDQYLTHCFFPIGNYHYNINCHNYVDKRSFYQCKPIELYIHFLTINQNWYFE